jgi:putative membrane protein
MSLLLSMLVWRNMRQPNQNENVQEVWMHVAMRRVILASLCGLPFPAFAHVIEDATADSVHWTFESWVLVCLGLSLSLYIMGAQRLRRRSKTRLIIQQASYFALGWLTLFVALVSPLDALGSKLFSAHMVQHELLMIVAAPLLVMSRPFGPWLWALPVRWRQRLGEAIRHPAVSLSWRFLSLPMAAWLIHALALWLWHVPVWFDAALENNTIHTLQHFSFLATALFFWWAVLDTQTSPGKSGAAMLYLFTTMIHTGALGALLTFSATPWYTAYDATMAFGFDALEDQQLGGLIMWIPGGIAYLVAGLVLGARWIRLSDRSTPGMR